MSAANYFSAQLPKPSQLCEHCKRGEAVIDLRVGWRNPIKLCALCYQANESSRSRKVSA